MDPDVTYNQRVGFVSEEVDWTCNCLKTFSPKDIGTIAAITLVTLAVLGGAAVGVTAELERDLTQWVIAGALILIIITAVVFCILYRIVQRAHRGRASSELVTTRYERPGTQED